MNRRIPCPNRPKITLKMPMIYRIESYNRREQPHVRFGESSSNEIFTAVLRKNLLDSIERVEYELDVCFIGGLRRCEASFIDAI